ncbi:MAG: ATP-binding protein [Acidimicrobiales bacterium]
MAKIVRGALGVGPDPARTPSDLLVDHLAGRRLLLVLDNCEHLAGACAELAGALLRSCAHVKVVATSREPLRVPGETVWRLPPMSLPDAVRLLLVRSTSANPALSPGEREQAAVERICRQLDGIPLALELAAARTTTLSFDELDRCLDDHLSLLTTGARTALPRQRTLRATIDWTHEALPDEERVLFRQLSVFAGGFTLDAVGAVVAGGDLGRPMLADLLGRLVDKSLVVADGLVEADRWARSTRYRLLETLRQYGAERLEASPEGASLRARHLDWARSLAQRGDAGLGGPEQAYWLEVLEAEHDNFRAALAWKPDLALAAALGRLWERRAHWAEGRSLLRLALEADGNAAPPAIRARALQGAGALAQRQGDYAAARQLLDESLSIARGIDDQSGVAASLLALGNVATSEGRHVEASTLYEQTMSMGRDIGDRAAVAAGAANLGWLAAMRWDDVRAIELLEESLALRRQLEDRHGAATVSTALGHVRRNRGEYALARSLHEESLRIQRDLGDRYGAAWSLTHLGLGLQWQGDTAAAGPLHEEALMIRRQIGDRLGVAWSLLHLADVLQAAGDFDGAARSLDDSLAAARSLKDPWCTNKGLTCAGRLARAAGDLDTAAARFAEALSIAVEHGFALAIATCLQEMGGVAAARGAFVRAARLLGAADVKRRSVRGVVHPCDAARYEGDLAATEAALGSAAFAGAFAEGATLSLDSLARSEATGQLQ